MERNRVLGLTGQNTELSEVFSQYFAEILIYYITVPLREEGKWHDHFLNTGDHRIHFFSMSPHGTSIP